jgi:hypothetical protein
VVVLLLEEIMVNGPGFAKGDGYYNTFVAELWRVLKGFSLVQRLRFDREKLSIDSKVFVHVIST